MSNPAANPDPNDLAVSHGEIWDQLSLQDSMYYSGIYYG